MLSTRPNLYAYTGNDPFDFIDPSGLCGQTPIPRRGSIPPVTPCDSRNGRPYQAPNHRARDFGTPEGYGTEIPAAEDATVVGITSGQPNVPIDAKPDVIVGLWSQAGVTQGIDGPTISAREVRKQSREKSNIFCLMFDTACLRTLAGFERAYSYRDLFSKATTKKVECRMVRDGKVLVGEVHVELHGGPSDENKGATPLEFDFS